MFALWKLIRSLKPSALVTALVVWNVLCLVDIKLHAGVGGAPKTVGAIAMGVTCGLLAAAALAVATSRWWQQLALRPGTDPREPRAGLLFIALLGLLLGAGALVGAFRN